MHIVNTKYGPVSGIRRNGCEQYLGIPYARPPVGERMFRHPEEPEPWTEVRMADRGSANPVQAEAGFKVWNNSLDCLYLNIFVPEEKKETPRPVMVWLYGGNYAQGGVGAVRPGSEALVYDLARFAAETDTVVVALNYRLNLYGFLNLHFLDPSFDNNNGLYDQIRALEFVRDNIAAFGGDPGNILVFGQSGGGAKIATMMAMPAAAGLFHRAITMSGQQVTASGPLNATKRAQAYLAGLGVKADDLSSLLSLSTAQLVEGLAAQDPILGGGLYMGPVLDMTHLARHPFWPDAPPQSQAIPMMLGNTHDETRAFIDPHGPKLKGLDWSNLAARIAPELRMDLSPEWIVAQYRARYPDWSAARIFYAATTAGRSWPGQVLEAEARAHADAPTWVYQVDFASPTQPERGAPHTMDIALAFGTLDAPGSFTGTGTGAQAASRALMQRFLAFARRGDPNGSGMAPWPQYRLDRRQTMIVDVDSHVESDPRGWERELFARVPYIQPGS